MRLACWGLVALLAGSGWVRAQPASPPDNQGPATVQDALHAMEQQAAIIFTGQVTAVRHRIGANDATGVVEIDFAIDDSVRGVSGGTYTLREWAGLWTPGEQCFTPGQRFLMLLHAPSAAGLSSPVGGMDGAIPIRGGPPSALLAAARAEQISAANAVAASVADTATDARVIDMRWIATRVTRPVQYHAAVPLHSTVVISPVHAEIKTRLAPTMSQQPSEMQAASDPPAANALVWQTPVAVAAGAAQDAGYTTVLSLLRGWGKPDAASR